MMRSFHRIASTYLALACALTGCVSEPRSNIEAFGFLLTPYIDITPKEDRSGTLITTVNQSTLTIEGVCDEIGGIVELLEPTSLATETTCATDGKWSLTLDFSALPDDVYQFRVRHYRVDLKKYFDSSSENYFKITQAPTSVGGVPSNSAVNTTVGGPTLVVSWEQGYDSSGTPLVGYEVSVTTGSQGSGTVLQQWTSVGTSTSTEISVPSGSNTEGGTFFVNIRGTDQAGQTTAPQSTEYEVDSLAPVFTVALSSSASVMASTSTGPTFSWQLSDGSGSGIAKIEYRITTVGSGATIRNWTSLSSASATQVSPAGLSLSEGSSYHFEVRALDLAGNESQIQSSDWSVPAPKLVFTSVPAGATIDTPFSVTVTFQDALNQTLTGVSSSVQLAAFSDSSCTSSASGTLTGGSVTASAGVAVFSSIQWNSAATLYLKATSPGYTLACSNALTVGVGNNPVPSVTPPDVWLKADAITGISSGGSLTTWSDSGPSGRNFSGGTAPSYQTLQINGLPAVNFSGTQYLKIAGTQLTRPASFTIISVIAPSSTSYTGYVYGAISGSSTTTTWGNLRQDTTNAIRYWADGTNYAAATSSSVFSGANTFMILSQRMTAGSTSDLLRKNGVSLSNSACTQCSTASNGISPDFAVGGTGDYAQRWSGKMAEILIYRSSLSTGDLQKIEAYLAQKYNFTLPLGVSRSGSGTLGLNINEQITVTGGISPYSYSVSGGGSITSTGLYTSPGSGSGTSVVTVTDSSGTPQSQTVNIPWRDPSLLLCNHTAIDETFGTVAALTSSPYSTLWNTFTDAGAAALSIDTSALKIQSSTATHFGGGLITKSGFSIGKDIEASLDLSQTGYYGCGGNDCSYRGIAVYPTGSTVLRDANYGSPQSTTTGSGIIELLNSSGGRALLSTRGVFGTGASLLDIGTYPLSTFQNLKVKINADSTYQVSHKGVSVYSGTLTGGALSTPFQFEFYAGNYSSSVGAIVYKMDNIRVIQNESGCP